MEPTDQTPPDLKQSPKDPPEAYEEKHVHEVYQQIAEHFSSTRYKVHIYTYIHIPSFSFLFLFFF